MTNSPAVPSAGDTARAQDRTRLRSDVPCPCPVMPTRTPGHPTIPIDIPPQAGVSDRAVQPATRWDIGHTRRDSTSGSGTLAPVRCPEGSPENVPSSFRAVPFTRMRHTIGQPRKRPAVRKPVDSPVKSRTACPFSGNCPERPVPFPGRCPERPVPFPGRCPERPVPFPGRCPIAWAPLRTMGLPAQNGLLLPIYASLACHRPLPDADNGKIGTSMRQRPRISSASKKSQAALCSAAPPSYVAADDC